MASVGGRIDWAPGQQCRWEQTGCHEIGDAAGGAALATGRGSAEENVRIPEVRAGGRGGARSDRGTPSFIFCNAVAAGMVPLRYASIVIFESLNRRHVGWCVRDWTSSGG